MPPSADPVSAATLISASSITRPGENDVTHLDIIARICNRGAQVFPSAHQVLFGAAVA